VTIDQGYTGGKPPDDISETCPPGSGRKTNSTILPLVPLGELWPRCQGPINPWRGALD
jgi:hypothetical protein